MKKINSHEKAQKTQNTACDFCAFARLFGRWILLIILAGHLLLRQEFAHRTLGEIVQKLGMGEWGALRYAYLTEVVLLLLLPLALFIVVAQAGKQVRPIKRNLPIFLALAFLLWDAGHAAVAFAAGHDTYLIFRQSALSGYALFFLYTIIFFGADARGVKQAIGYALLVAILCAAIDALAGSMVDPADAIASARHPVLAFLAAKPYGQETLPLAILGLGVFIVSAGGGLCATGSHAVGCQCEGCRQAHGQPTATAARGTTKRWLWRGLAMLALGLALWRQGARFQSVVPISLAGALVCYLLLGAGLALRGQRATLKRALRLAAFFVLLLALGGLALWTVGDPQKAARAAKVKGWSYKAYAQLFDIYNHAAAPAEAKDFVRSTRADVLVSDPEVYKLEAVFYATRTDLSTRQNIWRLLIWRRMLKDWLAGRTLLGAGAGQPWFYAALYHTHFHYGEDRLGLEPHNSFLNLLYRYGAIGFLLFSALLLAVLHCVWRALSRGGDAILEGVLLYFFYTLFFAFFVVSLEGPSYSMPFWMALGLAYVCASHHGELTTENTDGTEN